MSGAGPAPALDAELVARVEQGIAATRARIESAGGDPEAVTIVAVTKGFGAEAPRAAIAAGLQDLGENYSAELVDKAAAVAAAGGDAPAWHYLGRVQRRKVRVLAPVVSVWQGVCRVAEGEEIARRSPGATVLVEVDVTALPTRQGVPPADVPAVVRELRGCNLSVTGLMAVAAPGGGAEAQAAFELVVGLADDLELPVRSMGMSGDLEAAVRAGSTMVRVGEALFGPRPVRRGLAQ